MMKYRAYDLVLCVLLLVPIGVLIGLVALLVVLVDKHSPFYVSERIGQNEVPFLLIKIRTMDDKAPQCATSSHMSKYVTPLGSWLRRFSFDELPQIINILRGHMSWVGPRPCLHSEIKLIEERRRMGIFALKPGLTGLAQVNGRDTLSTEEKLYFEQRYMSCMSLSSHTYIIVKTILVVFLGKQESY
jgi:O-antigen biosynthesis protein WbqP